MGAAAEGRDGTAGHDPAGAPSGPLDRLDRWLDDDLVALGRAFGRIMLRRVPADQLESADPDALAGEIAAAFRFLAGRGPGKLEIRTLDPEVALDGWSTPGTVIQIAGEDRPFLVTTVTEELTRLGHQVIRALHPVVGVERDRDGRLVGVTPARGAPHRESLIHIELDSRLGEQQREQVVGCLRAVLDDVVVVTDHFPAMRRRLERLATELRGRAARERRSDGEAAEAAALIDWLLDDNFVLLGCRDYRVAPRPPGGAAGGPVVTVEAGSGVGILRDDTNSRYARPVPLSEADTGFQHRHRAARVLTVERSRHYSTVRTRVRMVNVWVRRPGRTVRYFRLEGIFARKAHAVPATTVPVLRTRLHRVLEWEDMPEGSHDERTVRAIFQTLPKDELFVLSADDLRGVLLELLAAEEAGQVRVLRRVDASASTVSVLVSIPPDRYGPDFRRQVVALLTDRYRVSTIDVDVSGGDRPQTVVRFVLHPPAPTPQVDIDELRQEIAALARGWSDELADRLVVAHGQADGRRLSRLLASRLPATYREHAPPARAAADVTAVAELLGLLPAGRRPAARAPAEETAEGARPEDELSVRLRPDPAGEQSVRLTIYRAGPAVEPSAILPILESLGLTVAEEWPFGLTDRSGQPEVHIPEVHIHDYGVRATVRVDPDRDGHRLSDAVLAAWAGRLEIDSLNRLVLTGGLDWPWVGLLRAYRRFRRQVGTVYTAGYQNDALVSNPEAIRALIGLFDARFNPDRRVADSELAACRRRLAEACEAITRLDHDRIVGGVVALVDATLRTSYYRRSAGSPLAIKLDSARVPDTPRPVPHREVFVYSPNFEGVHLRAGSVARGGIRLSDRQDDYRSEVLELMAAQRLKNAVIVPTGAKGGFVLRTPAGPLTGASRTSDSRAAEADPVRTAYAAYIGALLDVTDSIDDGQVRPPSGVRRADGDDPYLVVAADRGTAALSDLANRIAVERGFWLGDAFASGGSHGYDHKQLGITARGAWRAIARHFRELGMDVDSRPVRTVGIGDMSGDVFGNALLGRPTVHLVAAFDHRDVFLDPDPDPDRAVAERRRLFQRPGSSWQDYDRQAISAGGGVWSRQTKRVPLSPEVRRRLRVDAHELAPPQLIRAILAAPVDLLFAGGIGTFVKASDEPATAVGDRANEEVRIDASEVRARVVGEGANLAFTQRARIEYARRGGRINTDFIDNAAAVDLSDREVNLKILLRPAVEHGEMDAAGRDRLLTEVTEEVVEACLEDVDRQTGALTRQAADSAEALDDYRELTDELTGRGVVNTRADVLPDAEELATRRRAGAGLTRPELAVLMAATKRDLADRLAVDQLTARPALGQALVDYFPTRLFETHRRLVGEHPVRRALIAMMVTNEVVDRMGTTFVSRLTRDLAVDPPAVVAAWWVARGVAAAGRLWAAADRVDRDEPDLAVEVRRGLADLLEALTRRYVRAGDLARPEELIAGDRPACVALEDLAVERTGAGPGGETALARVDGLVKTGVESRLACLLARPTVLAAAPDVGQVTRRTAQSPSRVARVLSELEEALGLDWLRGLLGRVTPTDRWQQWHHRGLTENLAELARLATEQALTEQTAEGMATGREADEQAIADRFVAARTQELDRVRQLGRQLSTSGPPTLDAMAVVLRATRQALHPPDRLGR